MSMAKGKGSGYSDEHSAMLKEAMSRPGVREVMEIYERWRKADSSLDNYRQVTRSSTMKVVVSDRANGL